MIHLTVNGVGMGVDVSPGKRLSEVLREDLGLRGTKVGCNAGDCGACTVLLDGAAVCACLTPAAQAQGRKIETIEGCGHAAAAETDGVQQAFLRHGAAQCGMCTPGMVMAAQALLRQTATPTRKDVEVALAGVLCRCTGYTKIIDAVLDVAADGARADSAPVVGAVVGAAVGARVERLDGVAKVTGSEQFGADHVPEAALTVRAVRSELSAARFVFGDIEAWAAVHGVRVFTAKDVPGRNRFSVIPAFADQPVLAETSVRMRGEAVAVIAGQKAVVDALDLAQFPIHWDAIAAIETAQEAQEAGRNLIHETRPNNVLIEGVVRRGTVSDALNSAAFVVAREFVTGSVEHAYLEPEAGAAWMEGTVLNLRACTQAPVMDRDEMARVLGLPKDRVRVRPAATGGGFGAKLDLSVQPLIGLVTLLTGQPTVMVYSRQESMIASTKRHPARMVARIGADKDGRLVGMTFDGDFDTGAYSSWGPTVAVRVPVHASGPYDMPNYHATARAVHTNGPVSGAFRGFGVPQAAIVQETLFDELADAVGMDRLAFRRKNVLRDGVPTVCGQELQGVGIDACFAALQPKWDAALTAAAVANEATKGGMLRRGVGLAGCWYGCGNTGLPNPSTVRIGITKDGRLRLHQGAMDIGQGANTVIAQMAADAVGLPVHQFEVLDGDTFVTPDCGKTSASRQTFVTGKAAVLAGQSLRTQILSRCNLGANAQISLKEGVVTVGLGAEACGIPLEDLAENPEGYVLMGEETYDPPTTALDENGQGMPYAVYGYAAQMAEVEVDLTYGTVRVLKIVAAHDVGRVINPLLAEGQIEGGIAQGLGMALMEEYLPGRTENLHDYLIPTTGDMPQIEPILVEQADPEGPMGAKGLGEHALIPTAPAILNAIRDATGVAIERLPARPDRVVAGLNALARKGICDA